MSGVLPTRPGVGNNQPPRNAAIPSVVPTAAYRTLQFSLVGKPAAGQIYQIVLTESGTLFANCAGSQAHVITPPTAPWVFSLSIVSSSGTVAVGDVTINTAGNVSFPANNILLLTAGNQVRLTAPAVQDTTGADVAFGFRYQVNA